jgi:hypothetical protein
MLVLAVSLIAGASPSIAGAAEPISLTGCWTLTMAQTPGHIENQGPQGYTWQELLPLTPNTKSWVKLSPAPGVPGAYRGSYINAQGDPVTPTSVWNANAYLAQPQPGVAISYVVLSLSGPTERNYTQYARAYHGAFAGIGEWDANGQPTGKITGTFVDMRGAMTARDIACGDQSCSPANSVHITDGSLNARVSNHTIIFPAQNGRFTLEKARCLK